MATNFGVAGTNVVIGIIEHPTSSTSAGIKSDHHLGSRLVGQWDFNGLTPPAYQGDPSLPPVAGCAFPPAITSGSSDHATLVADIAAGGAFGSCIGVAPGAQVVAGHVDVGTVFTNGYHSSRAAIDWVFSTYYYDTNVVFFPNIFNLSFGYPGNDDGANSFALFLDWFTTSNNYVVPPLMVVAAGNDATLIRKPADSYNALTVGATDSALQRRLDLSSYQLAPDTRGKPDILAPGSGVSDGSYTSTGTSFAAPQVSGAAALIGEYVSPSGSFFYQPYFALSAKAIILNSARKRFISGLNAVHGISKDAANTSAEATDYDYLDGRVVRMGGSGSGPKTEDWTPAAWTNSAGTFMTTKPLDDEQGTGLLDVQRALTQMAGPLQTGRFSIGNVPLIGWSYGTVGFPTSQRTRTHFLTNSLTTNAFITATVVWNRSVAETNATQPNPGTCLTTTNTDFSFGRPDLYDTYTNLPLENLDLKIFRSGTILVAASISTVGNVEHLHIPVPVAGSNYSIQVSYLPSGAATNGGAYALAWWIGEPPEPPPNAPALDYGDAPDPPYPTYLANNGARHVIVAGVYLGKTADGDLDGQPNDTATGDDLISDDEDGVTFLTLLTPGRTATVEVVASTNAVLSAWIDFDVNGSWADAGEQILADQALDTGTNTLGFLVPANAVPKTNTFARFRFSTASGLSHTNSAPDGEVEDYQVAITCGAPTVTISISNSHARLTFATETNCTYTIEYKNSLSDATWSTLETLQGTGVPVTATDTNLLGATRFYRVKVF